MGITAVIIWLIMGRTAVITWLIKVIDLLTK